MRFFLVVLSALILVSVSNAQDVYIRSLTPTVTAQALRSRMVALQKGVVDYEHWWGGEHTVLKQGKAPKGAWQISISPPESVYYAGYHSVGPYGPYARVFTPGDPDNWTPTLTHELFEMLADPYGVRTVQSDKLYLVEVCDPVEYFSYLRMGVLISDFVGPDWYTGGKFFDKMGIATKAHQLLYGGYVSFWNGYDWAQIYAK